MTTQFLMDAAEGSSVNGPKSSRAWRIWLVVLLLIASATYISCIISPPSLMDDTDAVEAQIPRNMLTSGDWVTARLDGVIYLEKSPLSYWLTAVFYWIFGIHDWAARIPFALSAVGLALLVAAFGRWAFGDKAGFYAGLCTATCIGFFLFTRILIPDIMLTFTVTLGIWAFLRVLDQEEIRPQLWAYTFAASIGLGLLLKSLIGALFPLAACMIYLALTRQLLSVKVWKRIRPFSSLAIIMLIAVPWHVLATLRNPPYFAWTLHSGPGQYHGFLWFYFINEQLLRFLNLRYPRDYATVPRVYFWLLHLIWLFPWSVYLPALRNISFRARDRAGRTALMAVCWIGFVLVFFTFSTTQEYYPMPCWPAFALLLGVAVSIGGPWVRLGTRALTVVTIACAIAVIAILVAVRHVPTPGDISAALSKHPTAYKLSLGHMQDLTLGSFAYLRAPLSLALIAFIIGAIGTMRASGRWALLAVATMMVVFFQAARLAMVTFDPFLSSRQLAECILRSPPGTVIIDNHYYTFSSIAYYTGKPELLLNGRRMNFEYGSNAPSSPDVFIDDQRFSELWSTASRFYLVAYAAQLPRFDRLISPQKIHIVAASGGKLVITNVDISPPRP